MRFLKNLFHPLITFIAIQLVWVLIVVFWIYWFVMRHKELRRIAEHYRLEVGGRYDWLVLTEGILLLLVILVGVYVIFLYWNRQARLYRQQKFFISQVTHELKSPLASIQLHLETIRLRHPSPQQMESFVEIMMNDAQRLNSLINNLLMAARLEQAQLRKPPIIDLSQVVTDFLEPKRATLPAGGKLQLEVEPNIMVPIELEAIETALRNLLENALLYSSGLPDIRVMLYRKGKRCVLTFEDNGRGMDPKELKKVFQMFYRIRHQGENIQGTGLGLYIVKTVVTEHRGTIKAISAGIGKGTKFIITLPLSPIPR